MENVNHVDEDYGRAVISNTSIKKLT